MKYLFYPINIFNIFFILFTLTSCQSDTSSGKTKNDEQKVPHTSTDHESGVLKSIDVADSLSMNPITEKANFEVQSKCWNNYLEEFSETVRIKNTNTLPVKDILPVRVFTPTLNPEIELFCDFDIKQVTHYGMEIKNTEKRFREVKIENVNTYSDFQINLENLTRSPGKPLYLGDEHIKEAKIIMPADKTQVFTLCEKEGRVGLFEGWVLPMSEFFDKKLFQENSFQLCRFLIHQQDTKKNWISEAFFIQNEPPKLSYQYKPNYSAKIDNQWNGGKMGTFNLFNEGSSTAYFRLILPSATKMSVMAVYSNFSKEGVNHRSNILELNAFWAVDGGTPLIKDGEILPEFYQLEPGQTMTLSLYTNNNFTCGFGQALKEQLDIRIITQPYHYQMMDLGDTTNLLNRKGFHNNPGIFPPGSPLNNGFDIAQKIINLDCKEIFYLSGMLYDLHDFPQIIYNLFSTTEHESWKSLSLEKIMERPYNDEFSTWVPSYTALPYCPELGVKQELKNYPTENTDLNLNGLFRCYSR